jgi:DNA-binding MarR family transcriptional regulator
VSQESQSESIDFMLAQVCRLHHARARALLEGIGLYRGQPPLLFALGEKDGRAHSELAEHLHVQPATITKMVKRVERAGFVERRRDSEDQRVSRVYLTERGQAIQEEAKRMLYVLEGEMLAGFTSEDHVLLRQFLAHIRDNLMQATGRKLPF